MERLILPFAGGLAAFVLTLPLACGSAFTAAASGSNDGGPDSDALPSIEGAAEGGDGTLPEAGLGDGGTPGDGGTSEEGTVEASGPGTIVYVSSTTGDDDNVGTNPAKPKKSIAAALMKAQAIGAAASVEVCKGTYVETALTLDQSIPLRGAYDCTSWERSILYGYPIFDGTYGTVIENEAPSVQAATLLVTGNLTSAAVIDGFLIAGATASTTPTVGLEVVGSASPLIANDVISGGGGVGSASSAGSIAVDILGGSPEVRFSQLSGGGGTGSPGSAGIVVTSTGSPYVHDDIISGGSGTPTSVTGDLASVGVQAGTSMTQATALKNLVVTASDVLGVAGSSAGIMVSGTGLTVDIESSEIHGGTGSPAGTFSEGVAVNDASGMTRLLSDRIYGGDRSGASSQTYGVQVVEVASLSVSDSEIHAGTAAASVGASSIGVDVASATALTVTFDTIYSGQGSGAALSVGEGVSGVVVTDDLLAGGGPGISATAVVMGSCSGELADLDYTAFVNFDDLYSCPDDVPPTTIPALATAVPGATTTGDIELESGVCAAATSCVPDSSCPAAPASCLPSLFGASWTTDDGVTGLFDGPPAAADAAAPEHGWSLLGATIPCALARGGTPIDGTVTDVFGQARSTTKPTIGAAEYTSTSCSN
jgi:hypothetical protein